MSIFSEGINDLSEQENDRYVEAKFYPTLLMDEDGYSRVDERYRFLQPISKQKNPNENFSQIGNETLLHTAK